MVRGNFIFLLTNHTAVHILSISSIYSCDGRCSCGSYHQQRQRKAHLRTDLRQIKNCILSGELSPGDALPSIRALAKDLRISVITTTRAYDELERDGFIDRVPGKGCYVAEQNLELVREAHLKQIEDHMGEIVSLAQGCSLTEEEAVRMLRLMWEMKGSDAE